MRRLSDAEVRMYGFRWKQLDVTRSHEYRGSLCVEVRTDHQTLHIYVSPKGHRVRVFRSDDFGGSRELKDRP